MKKPFKSDARCYCLIVRHSQKETVEVGSLGQAEWPEGWFYYVGRSQNGWGSRFKRFNRSDQRLFWHIDYLVNASFSTMWGIIPFDVPASRECRIAGSLSKLEQFELLLPGLGASDCDAGCDAHGWVSSLVPPEIYSRPVLRDFNPEGLVRFQDDRTTWETNVSAGSL